MVGKRGHASLRVAVDVVIMTVRVGELQVLVVERGNEPFRGWSALPGGFLRTGESPDDAARRELEEETGLRDGGLHLEQLRSYGAPDRDPRGRVISIAYLAIAPSLPAPTAGSDARAARWEPVRNLVPASGGLAFDHDEILADAVERARAKLEYTTLATAFCPDAFTIGELRHVYEAVWGIPLDPRNFNRKVTNTEGFIEPLGATRRPGTGRPAALYRRGPATLLHPAMLRPDPATIDGTPTKTAHDG